ncbi:undecaprenyl-diphosphate phosphatase [Metabacillus arenae]|uniref:Undecaprenyl-diphosphatase n=1 Tax=Metabacillus arenae TaxID=2771434 RepID=A0A926NFU3_9BACI|nr:undecaprenyl-diphosphate phosphatase [Metabacillus arenae]MBD1380335.1 undecaprenyl-diphosphate phosphatase [Metabacillus arenae]
MNWIEALILGIVQGLTEFLPISSTGHLYLGRKMFGLQEAGLFLDTMLHIGTFIALVVFYKDILFKVVRNPFSKLSFLLIVGTIPAVIAGLMFDDFFDEISVTGSTIGWEFLLTGTFLWFADRLKNGVKKIEDISFADSLFIGCFQAFAIFPAVSRSGMTIAGALMRKIEKETAAYFSFLLSIPAIFGAIVLQSSKLISHQNVEIGFFPLLVATMSAAFFGYAAVKWMIRFVKNHSLKLFASYVWILGFFIIVMQGLDIF